MNQSPTIAIIGPGKVGTSVGILAAQAGYSVVAVGGRRKADTVATARRIGKDVCACDVAEASQLAQMILLCLPDDAIEQVCEKLAQENKFTEGAVVVHCSGALSSDILSAARKYCRCSVASMHPLQTFPTVEAAIKAMKGTYCFYEGDERAITVVKHFATDIGLRPTRISSTSKTLYHVAAVMACNYFVALIDSAIAIAEKAGIDRAIAWSAIEPLVAATLNNVTEMGTIDSLTGPIARGDVKTIRRHLEELSAMPGQLASVYRTMGLYTLEMAIRKRTITATKAAEITKIICQDKIY